MPRRCRRRRKCAPIASVRKIVAETAVLKVEVASGLLVFQYIVLYGLSVLFGVRSPSHSFSVRRLSATKSRAKFYFVHLITGSGRTQFILGGTQHRDSEM